MAVICPPVEIGLDAFPVIEMPNGEMVVTVPGLGRVMALGGVIGGVSVGLTGGTLTDGGAGGFGRCLCLDAAEASKVATSRVRQHRPREKLRSCLAKGENDIMAAAFCRGVAFPDRIL